MLLGIWSLVGMHGFIFEIPPYTGSRVPQSFSDFEISANLAEFSFGVSSNSTYQEP